MVRGKRGVWFIVSMAPVPTGVVTTPSATATLETKATALVTRVAVAPGMVTTPVGTGAVETKRPDTVLATDSNWVAAAQEHVQFTQKEIESACEIMIWEGYTISEGAMLKWLLHSGASKHMCNDRELFTMLVPHCAEVEFGNGV